MDVNVVFGLELRPCMLYPRRRRPVIETRHCSADF